MGNPPAEKAVSDAPPRHGPLFLLGVVLFFLGPGIFFVYYVQLRHLTTPWYLLVLSTAGVLLMALSAWQRRSAWRGLGVIVLGLVCGLEWFFIVSLSRVPAYTGPAQPGRKLPAFTAALADGRSFTEKDLEDGKPAALVFYRGHW
jgi:CDP-diglyceride synthetase